MARWRTALRVAPWVACLICVGCGPIPRAMLGSITPHDPAALATVSQVVQPAIERFLADELLVKSGPITWTPPVWRSWESSGETNVLALGSMTNPRVTVRGELYPSRSGDGPEPQGLRLGKGSLQINLPLPKEVAKLQDAAQIRRALTRMGVLRPEFVAAFGKADHSTGSFSLQYRGRRYSVNTHTYTEQWPRGPYGEVVAIHVYGP